MGRVLGSVILLSSDTDLLLQNGCTARPAWLCFEAKHDRGPWSQHMSGMHHALCHELCGASASLSTPSCVWVVAVANAASYFFLCVIYFHDLIASEAKVAKSGVFGARSSLVRACTAFCVQSATNKLEHTL